MMPITRFTRIPQTSLSCLVSQSNLAKELFFHPFDLVDVNKLDDNELLTLKEFGLMAYALKHGRNKNDIIPYIRKLVPELGELDKSEDGRQYNIKLISYLLKGEQDSR